MNDNTYTPVNTSNLPAVAVLAHGGAFPTGRIAACSSSFLEEERFVPRPHGQARILEPREIERLFKYVASRSRIPGADILKIALSIYAGLRASEISGLTIDDMVGPSGQVANVIRVPASIAKGGHARIIPMHPRIATALTLFRMRYPDAVRIAISPYRHKRYQKSQAIVTWFYYLYRAMGLKGCSSHSGRRTFITNLARSVGEHGCSLRDVQQMAGHKQLDTTAGYIGYSDNVMKLVSSMGSANTLPFPQRKECRS